VIGKAAARSLPWPAPRRMPVSHLVPRRGRRPEADRGVAPRRQWCTAAQQPRGPYPCSVRAALRPREPFTRPATRASQPRGRSQRAH